MPVSDTSARKSNSTCSTKHHSQFGAYSCRSEPKKGNLPSVDTRQPSENKGTIPERHEHHDDIGFTAHEDGSISVDIDDSEIIRGMRSGTRNDFKMVLSPKRLHMLGRFLAKVGLGMREKLARDLHVGFPESAWAYPVSPASHGT